MLDCFDDDERAPFASDVALNAKYGTDYRYEFCPSDTFDKRANAKSTASTTTTTMTTTTTTNAGEETAAARRERERKQRADIEAAEVCDEFILF